MYFDHVIAKRGGNGCGLSGFFSGKFRELSTSHFRAGGGEFEFISMVRYRKSD